MVGYICAYKFIFVINFNNIGFTWCYIVGVSLCFLVVRDDVMNQKTLTTIKGSFDENRNSHAFLMETNNIETCLEEIKKLIFSINNIESESLNDENIVDIKVIRPEGKEIKREQISMILEEFQTFPVMLKHRYYIIIESDKMNQSSANTILKFLEEPDGDVIGFFITSNKNAMISTIISRCQHYKLFYDTHLIIDFEKVQNFLNNMECRETYKKILYLNNFISKDRVENIKFFKDLKDYLFENKKEDDVEQIKLLVKRVRLLDNVVERLLKNANQELVILELARNWK